ncbi:PREDICTED: metastasis-associated protein MTA3-like [Tinamus guttatus]|nr:PREDICTED: metastasis-associated protein MTA3-like [Tinamus guttatus]
MGKVVSRTGLMKMETRSGNSEKLARVPREQVAPAGCFLLCRREFSPGCSGSHLPGMMAGGLRVSGTRHQVPQLLLWQQRAPVSVSVFGVCTYHTYCCSIQLTNAYLMLLPRRAKLKRRLRVSLFFDLCGRPAAVRRAQPGTTCRNKQFFAVASLTRHRTINNPMYKDEVVRTVVLLSPQGPHGSLTRVLQKRGGGRGLLGPDLGQNLDQSHLFTEEVEEESETTIEVDLTDKQKHQLKHRELFLSRQYESLPATHIRGKCSVALLNETESVLSYLEKEDTFFYSLVYDPSLKTLLADKGEIRVGPRYQADVPDMLAEGELDDREQAKLEVKVWDPDSPLTDRQIDQFLVVARAVGTFARALDCSSSVRQPSLHMSAAAASRDITLFHAMDTLHKHNYDLSSAISVLVPLGGPVLCRDEMEEWSASEASLFEEALEKYGKDFNDIRQDFLPWKSLTSIIEYYYMWKTTDRYVQQVI